MAGFKITVTDSLGNIVESMESAITRCNDFGPMWADLRRPWEQSRLDMFRTNGRSIGHPWVGYDETSEADWYVWWKAGVLGIAIRSAADLNRLLLRWPTANERMFPSLTDTRSRFAVWRPEPLSLTMGSRLGYVGDTDAGTSRNAPREMGGAPVPRRRLLAFGSEFVKETGLAVGVQAARVTKAIDAKKAKIRAGLTTRQVLARLTGRML